MAALEKLAFRPVFMWAARRAIVGRSRSESDPRQGRFTRRDVDRLLARAWRRYDELAPHVPREPGLGPKLNVRLAAATLAFHRALVESGIEKHTAIRLVADAAWQVFRRWGLLPRLLARIATRDPEARMPICVDLFLRFPFSQPAYRFDVSRPDDRAIAIDMHRCPVADFFRSQGAADVCARTWCTQDFALAELWGGALELTGTLAGGAERCDFRFRSAAPRRESRPRPASPGAP